MKASTRAVDTAYNNDLECCAACPAACPLWRKMTNRVMPPGKTGEGRFSLKRTKRKKDLKPKFQVFFVVEISGIEPLTS